MRGEVDYLALVGPADIPLTTGGVDFAPAGDAGEIYRLATMPALRSLGLATVMIEHLEQAIRRRGRARSTLFVGVDNPRAAALYERLGYDEVGRETLHWTTTDAEGSVIHKSSDARKLQRHLT